MDKKALILFTFLFLALIISGTAFSAVCPETTPLGAITGVGDAHMPAIDSRGNVYITQNTLNKISIYTQSGRLLRSVNHNAPLAIAVDGSGIYVTDSAGNLTIYDFSFNPQIVIPTGVKLPSGVTVSPDRVYVSDPLGGRILIYGRGGQFIKSFGGDGGTFVPGSMFYDSSVGRLYVVNDAPAGIMVFDADGNFISKSTSDAWTLQGVLGAPRGIFIDSAGRAYIADALQLQAYVFDKETGANLCSFGASETMQRPFGVSIGGNGILYLTDKDASKVYAVGVDNYTKMDVSPLSLSYSAAACGIMPPTKAINISNSGRGEFNWTASSNASWITIGSTFGTLTSGQAVEIPISVNPSGLGQGTHQGVITIAASGAEETISVTLDVVAPPVLSASPSSFSFSVKGTETPASETLNIELSNDPTGQALWSVSSTSWIGVTPTSGPSNTLSMASVSPIVDSLSGGSYEGTITISSECASGSPILIPVTLNYIKGGKIEVVTNIPEASYTITGPATYSGTGLTYSIDGAPEGTYTITFGAVSGYKAPAPYSLSVSNGGTIQFVGNYKDLRKKLKIIASLEEGSVTPNDEIRIFDSAGTLKGSFVIDGRTGRRAGTDTSSGDIDGDGLGDIVVGTGRVVSAYKANGEPISGVRFTAFKRSDVDVSVADLNGDGVVEIIVGAASKGSPSELRVFNYEGGSIRDSGINFIAFRARSGMEIASGDIDGDGISEIITSQNNSIRLWKIDTSGGLGAWKVIDVGGFNLPGSIDSITSTDVDGDDVAEIISAVRLDNSLNIGIYRADGSLVRVFSVSMGGNKVSISAGDTDYDGAPEIAVSSRVGSRLPALVTIYDSFGNKKGQFSAFDSRGVRGIRISMGEVSE